ncbi:TRAP transporter small permease subunit [Acuticoccus sp.]|uniref:TRAP transporter small permease subunit n=1 Tax=Acuticoccus sp. TaxID=1904378 RepID=UPI003B5218D4
MLARAVAAIDAVIAALGRAAAFTVLGIIAVILFEMVMRGWLGRSQPWTGDVSAWLLAALIFLGGPWALARGHFVRVDALYDRFSPRAKALVDTLVSTALFALFVGVLLRFGWSFFAKSYAIGEVSATGAWSGPVWLAKGLLPLGAALLVLAWASHLYHVWAGPPDARR